MKHGGPCTEMCGVECWRMHRCQQMWCKVDRPRTGAKKEAPVSSSITQAWTVQVSVDHEDGCVRHDNMNVIGAIPRSFQAPKHTADPTKMPHCKEHRTEERKKGVQLHVSMPSDHT